LLTQVLEQDPDWTQAVLLLGGAYTDLRNTDQAGEVYRKFLDRNPRDAMVMVRYLDLLNSQGLTGEASRLLDRAQLQGPLSVFRALLAIRQSDTEGAHSKLESHLDLYPKDVAARVLLAQVIY